MSFQDAIAIAAVCNSEKQAPAWRVGPGIQSEQLHAALLPASIEPSRYTSISPAKLPLE